jgi:hypothetical protein
MKPIPAIAQITEPVAQLSPETVRWIEETKRRMFREACERELKRLVPPYHQRDIPDLNCCGEHN